IWVSLRGARDLLVGRQLLGRRRVKTFDFNERSIQRLSFGTALGLKDHARRQPVGASQRQQFDFRAPGRVPALLGLHVQNDLDHVLIKLPFLFHPNRRCGREEYVVAALLRREVKLKGGRLLAFTGRQARFRKRLSQVALRSIGRDYDQALRRRWVEQL